MSEPFNEVENNIAAARWRERIARQIAVLEQKAGPDGAYMARIMRVVADCGYYAMSKNTPAPGWLLDMLPATVAGEMLLEEYQRSLVVDLGPITGTPFPVIRGGKAGPSK